MRAAWQYYFQFLIGGLVFIFAQFASADSLEWRTNGVTADIKSADLPRVLQQVARDSGWNIYLEPDTTHEVSTKFKNLPPGDALRLLLGNLNFALVPQTNARSRLFVFRTSQKNATQMISPANARLNATDAKEIGNELIVTLKPGGNIDELARLLGAKVTGRLPELNAYRLQFEDENAADAARAQLAGNSDVAAVENNFAIDQPTVPRGMTSSSTPRIQLNAKTPDANGRIIIGLIDTAVQPLGNGLDSFLLKQISVAGDSPADLNSPLHGTAMAETMLRSLQIATKGNTSVQILPVDVYGGNESTSTFDVAKGIAAAINEGGATILNLSLGSYGESALLQRLIQQASVKNIPIFAAAGNDPVTAPFFPAAYDGATAVTAGSSQGTIANYANHGSFIDLVAPDSSTIYFNTRPYFVRGTSASSAFTSGLAAGWLDVNRGSSVGQMQTFLKNNFPVKTSSTP